MNYATDPDFLNGEFIDQIKWLLKKEPAKIANTTCRMMENRRNTNHETAHYSAVFWGTITFNHITKDN